MSSLTPHAKAKRYPPMSTATTMATISLLLPVVLAVLMGTPAHAYNDERPYYKWAPQSLYSAPSYYKPSPPSIYARSESPYTSFMAGADRPKPYSSHLRSRYDRGSFFPSSGSSSSNYMDSTSLFDSKKRAEDYSRAGCMSPGQLCLFRSGLVGAVMKLPCCEGATCTLMGSKFVCVDDKELYEPLEQEGLEPETIQIDPEDLAGWNQEIFGKKK